MILMILISILVFRFLQVTAAVKLVITEPYPSKYLSVKTTNACFSQPLTPNKTSCQPLPEPKIWTQP